jgi:dTDP-N-acetylfucosamine:lipid II N-acetylfucosaminyltransferase
MRFLHLGSANKFTIPFFYFLKENFDLSKHKLLFWQQQVECIDSLNDSLVKKNGISYAIHFFKYANKAEKIILHSLFDPRIIILLALQPWLLKRCYWIIWGGDLYSFQQKKKGISFFVKEIFKKIVIKHVGYLLSYIDGDIVLAREIYSAKGVHLDCLMYQSNVFNQPLVERSYKNNNLNIMIGNSADPSNNHVEIIDKLYSIFKGDFYVYIPLSYGDSEYKEYIIDYAKRKFQSNFISLTNFMEVKEYNKFLESIDIVIFNHDRQQGMGNLISLLGFGKTVYIKNNVTPWFFFEKIGVKIFSSEEIDLFVLSEQQRASNVDRIKAYFSYSKFLNQWREIFK